MHSSILRGSDFRLRHAGREIPHDEFFGAHTRNTRLGILAPAGTEGVGAVTFALACVTAFYDTYRRQGGEFFAYPDFFTFQRGERLASYGSFDFWPDKDVRVPEDPDGTLAVIADRAVNILLVPDTPSAERPVDRVQTERCERLLERCFAYCATGLVTDPDLAITCAAEPLRTYAVNVLRSVRNEWPDWLANLSAESVLSQSFRELPVDAALDRL